MGETGLLATKPVPSGQFFTLTASYGESKPPLTLTGSMGVTLTPP